MASRYHLLIGVCFGVGIGIGDDCGTGNFPRLVTDEAVRTRTTGAAKHRSFGFGVVAHATHAGPTTAEPASRGGDVGDVVDVIDF